MPTDTTAKLNLPLIAAAQAQKHVTHNEALEVLDTLVQATVLDRDLTVPPASPAEGDSYIVAAAATGDWAGHDGEIASFRNGGWVFHAPRPGWLAHVADENAFVFHDGTQWVELAAAIADLQNLLKLGVNTTADDTNRLAVKSDAVLFSHDDASGSGSGDMRLKFNKAASANTASLLFQSNWSGRAEVGLTGDDMLRLKVSPDGSSWLDGLIMDQASATVAFPATPLAQNLLINGDFAINQRDFQGGSLAAGTYGHDRWRAGSAGATLNISNGTVTLVGELEQVIEAPGLAGATVVISVEDLSGGPLDVDIAGATATIQPGTGRVGATLVLPATASGNITVRLSAATQVDFARVMLTHGAAASPWNPRPPAQEIALCQRYFQRISYMQYQSVAAGRINWNGRVDFVLKYLRPMRAQPTITFVNGNTGNVFEVNAASGTAYFTNYDRVISYSLHEATISLDAVSGDTNKVAYVRCSGPQDVVHFDIDAEL